MARRYVGTLLSLLLLIVGVVALGAAPAVGQENGEALLTIREVDGTDPDAVRLTFLYAGDRDAVSNLVVRAGGNQVETSAPVPLTDDRRLGVVLAIDVSGSMEENAAIERAREAASAYVADKRADEEIAIVAFGSEGPQVLQDFTTDEAQLQDAIDDLALTRTVGTHLYDALRTSAGLFGDGPVQPNILLLSDGADVGSRANFDAAVTAVNAAKAAVFAIGIQSESLNEGELRALATQTGGSYLATDDPVELEALFGEVRETLSRQYVVTFPSQADAGSGAVDLTVTIGSSQAQASFTPGSLAAGARELRPVPVAEPGGPEFLRSSGGYYLALALVLAGVALLVYSLITIFSRDRTTLQATLQPYGEGYVAAADTDEDDDPRSKGLAQTQILQRAVELTGKVAEERGVLPKIEAQLERANLPLRAAEAIFFYLASVVVLTLLGLVISQNLLVALVVLIFVAMVPPAILSFLANRRRKQFEAMLPDTLQLMSSTLRAGYSLMQGVEAVSQEVAEPMGRELRRVVTESRLGRPLEVALQGVADRMDSPDFAWAVMAIRIQREVGGNLAELLLTVAETMTQRERLRRDVSALTAEGRISAIVLGVLPVGLGLIMYVINPDYIGVLFDKTIGNIMLIGSLILAGVGFYWMKKVIDIDI